MSQFDDEKIKQVIDKLFQQFDFNNSGYLEIREVTQLINLNLRHGGFNGKAKMSDARDFLELVDRNNDEKISKKELIKFFKDVLNRANK